MMVLWLPKVAKCQIYLADITGIIPRASAQERTYVIGPKGLKPTQTAPKKSKKTGSHRKIG